MNVYYLRGSKRMADFVAGIFAGLSQTTVGKAFAAPRVRTNIWFHNKNDLYNTDVVILHQ